MGGGGKIPDKLHSHISVTWFTHKHHMDESATNTIPLDINEKHHMAMLTRPYLKCMNVTF